MAASIPLVGHVAERTPSRVNGATTSVLGCPHLRICDEHLLLLSQRELLDLLPVLPLKLVDP